MNGIGTRWIVLATSLAASIVVVLTLLSSAAAPSPAATTTAAAKVKVPRVIGFRLDRATRTLRARGLRVNEECSGLFGCIVKSGWWVCEQDPRAGRKLRRYAVVVVYAARRGEC